MKKILAFLLLTSTLLFCTGCPIKTVSELQEEKITETEFYKYMDWNGRYVLEVKDAALVNGDTWVIPEEIDGEPIKGVAVPNFMADPIYVIAPNQNVKHLVFSHEVICYPNQNIKMSFLSVESIVVNGSCIPSSLTLEGIKHAVFKNSSSKSLYNVTSLRSLEVNWTSFTMQSLAPLEYLRFQEGVKTISSEIFRELPLKQVVLPETVTRISADSFAGCEDFTVFLRAEEPLPGFEEGWDKDVRVVWGFAGETVTFDSYGGSRVVFPETGQNYQIAEAGGKLQKPEDPVREGYTFGGWYKDFYFRELWDFETDTVQETCCLWAKWIPA